MNAGRLFAGVFCAGALCGCVGDPWPAAVTPAAYSARIQDGTALVIATRAWAEVRRPVGPIDCAAALANPAVLQPAQFGPVAARDEVNGQDGSSSVLELAPLSPACGVALVRVTHDTFWHGLAKSDPFYVVWDRPRIVAARRPLAEAQRLTVGVVHSDLKGATVLVSVSDPSVRTAPAPKDTFEK